MDLREPFLAWQQRAAIGHPILERAIDLAHGWLDRRLERAVVFGAASPAVS